jgi:hypothetical protein
MREKGEDAERSKCGFQKKAPGLPGTGRELFRGGPKA